jgi:hypothetical protein
MRLKDEMIFTLAATKNVEKTSEVWVKRRTKNAKTPTTFFVTVG